MRVNDALVVDIPALERITAVMGGRAPMDEGAAHGFGKGANELSIRMHEWLLVFASSRLTQGQMREGPWTRARYEISVNVTNSQAICSRDYEAWIEWDDGWLA